MQTKIYLLLFILLSFKINYSQGKLWGMTITGGQYGVGCIYNTDGVLNNQSIVHDFYKVEGGLPYDNTLVEASNGMLYGTCSPSFGGQIGILFEYNPSTGQFSKKVDFNGVMNGAIPEGSLILASNGKFYGVTSGGGTINQGTLFEYNPITNLFIKKIEFDPLLSGRNPKSSLVQASNGKLYGLTYNGGVNDLGVLFEYDPSNNSCIKRIDFDGALNGSLPDAGLIQASDGKLYGVTTTGGVNDYGILFQFDPLTNSLTKKIDFDGVSNGSIPKSSLIETSNGVLVGTTLEGGIANKGVLFKYDISGNSYTKMLDFDGLSNGESPQGILTQASDGNLYGVTASGGLSGKGVLFQYDLITNNFTKKIEFSSIEDGIDPLGGVIQCTNGKLYGMTNRGGLSNLGVLFEYDITSGTSVKKIDFGEAINGSYPVGKLFKASDGKLYGMTSAGGQKNIGTLFQYDPNAHQFTKKIDFDGISNGASPYGNLMETSNGMLYGLTLSGGANNLGVMFKYDIINNVFTKLLDFDRILNGANPFGSLTQAADGKLYGLTSLGGNNDDGVFFSYDPNTSNFTKLIDLYGQYVALEPDGNVLEASNGKLYFTTRYDGFAQNYGLIFGYDPITSTGFYVGTGGVGITGFGSPTGSLIQATDGNLWGLSNSEIFAYNPVANSINHIVFDGINGSIPEKSSLTQAANGKLYGVTGYGGTNDMGVLFEYDFVNDLYSKKIDFTGPNGSSPSGGLIELPGILEINSSLPVSVICVSDSINIPYSGIGSFTSGNVFTVQLSDMSGSFISPLSIGSATSVSSGTIHAFIPSTIPTSNSYRIRVVGSNPIIIGDDNPISIVNGTSATLTVTGTNSICIGSTATIIATGAPIYIWNTGVNTSSITISPTITSNYIVTGTNYSGCSDTHTISIVVNQTCQDTWPGDANSDGTANNLDVLELGLHFTQTGPARATTSNNWQSYFSNNWTGTLSNGKNINHSDCNGDGVIDGNDTLAIYTNYGLTHAFKLTQQTIVNPQLSIVPDQAFVNKGDWGTASVFLGEASNAVTNVNGIAFTLDFDHTLLETNSVWIEYPVSFMDNGQNLHFRKADFLNGKLYAATTHTNAMNSNGSGKIAILHYRIKSSLTTDATLGFGISQAYKSDASGVIDPITAGTASVMAVGASVGLNELASGSYVALYPNPAVNEVMVSSGSLIDKLEITSITGQSLLKVGINAKNYSINTSELSNGIYFIRISSNGVQTACKKLLIQK